MSITPLDFYYKYFEGNIDENVVEQIKNKNYKFFEKYFQSVNEVLFKNELKAFESIFKKDITNYICERGISNNIMEHLSKYVIVLDYSLGSLGYYNQYLLDNNTNIKSLRCGDTKLYIYVNGFILNDDVKLNSLESRIVVIGRNREYFDYGFLKPDCYVCDMYEDEKYMGKRLLNGDTLLRNIIPEKDSIIIHKNREIHNLNVTTVKLLFGNILTYNSLHIYTKNFKFTKFLFNGDVFIPVYRFNPKTVAFHSRIRIGRFHYANEYIDCETLYYDTLYSMINEKFILNAILFDSNMGYLHFKINNLVLNECIKNKLKNLPSLNSKQKAKFYNYLIPLLADYNVAKCSFHVLEFIESLPCVNVIFYYIYAAIQDSKSLSTLEAVIKRII